MHAGARAARPNGHRTARLDDAGGCAEALVAELGVAQTVAVASDVAQALARLGVVLGVDGACPEDSVELAFVQCVAP